jgi:hypothetical protein
VRTAALRSERMEGRSIVSASSREKCSVWVVCSCDFVSLVVSLYHLEVDVTWFGSAGV